MILALIFLSLAVVCYSISQLQQHGKLSWSDPENPRGFWGAGSYARKYKNNNFTDGPAFWLSTTLLVFLTDGYHFMQFMFFNFLSLSITFSLGFQWLTLGLVWGLIHVIHFITYRLLQK